MNSTIDINSRHFQRERFSTSPSEISFHIGSDPDILISFHRTEMFAVRRSDENELERNFLPACFGSPVPARTRFPALRVSYMYLLCDYQRDYFGFGFAILSWKPKLFSGRKLELWCAVE